MMTHLFIAVAELQTAPRLSHSGYRAIWIVELFCSRGPFGEFLKIKDVLPSLLKNPVGPFVIILHTFFMTDQHCAVLLGRHTQ